MERLGHILKHPEMANQLEQIKDALQHPLKITNCDFDEKLAYYYKYSKENNNYLRVIVKYLNGNGYIITAYFVRNIQ